MSQPVVVSIPHRLGKEEALSRLKNGFGRVRTNFSQVLAIEEEIWSGERMQFRVRALGQAAAGTIEVEQDHVRLEVNLPWLLAQLVETVVPAIRREGTLLLEKK